MKKSDCMKKLRIFGISLLIASMSNITLSESSLEGRKQVVLRGEIAQVCVDVAGGAIVDFHLIDQGLNPLTWNYPEKGDLSPRHMGHIICFDRLGRPSKKEADNGMPFHGEGGLVIWKVLSKPSKKNGVISTEMMCELPMARMTLKRTLNLYEKSSVLKVREVITNINQLGKVYNLVQHPTIAPPFLDESVVIDCNAYKGFWVGNPMPYPEEPVVYWPKLVFKGKLADMRRLVNDHEPGVVSFMFKDGVEYGWVTACNINKGLMLGYIWQLSDYTWYRKWRQTRGKKPVARGLEFGTTPLPVPFKEILAKGKIFDRPVYEYLDSMESIVKTYTAFLSKIPADYIGVEDVGFKNGNIVIKERDSSESSDIIIKMK